MGFADCYLIRQGGKTILVDVGDPNPDEPSRMALSYLRDAGVTQVDMCIVTHWHLDHCQDLNNMLAEFGTADTLVYGPSEKPFHTFDPLSAGQYSQLRPGDVAHIGGLTFYCVGPDKLQANGRKNDDSLNFVLEFGQFRMLFTGDAAAHNNIVGPFKDICSDVTVLKFPHHGMKPFMIYKGSARTTSPEWVIVPGVVPKWDVWWFFSENGAPLPKENVLDAGDGNIVILTDGQGQVEVVTRADPHAFAPQIEL